MGIKRKSTWWGLLIAVALSAAVSFYSIGCGKKDKTNDDEATGKIEGTEIIIAGSLALTGVSTTLALTSPALTELKVYCVTFSMPPVAGTGVVAADGSFSLTLAAAQVTVGCFILDTDENQLGSIVFKDESKKGLGGGSKTEQRMAFTDDVNFGQITLNLATGKAEVNVANISTSAKNTAAANAEAYDFTASYTINSAGITLPTGYSGTCLDRESNDCRGPVEGEEIWIKRLDGKSTADSSKVFGIMVWQSENHFKECGSKLGVSYADIKAHGVDLSDSGVAEGGFTWKAGLVDGWKDPAATAKYAISKMERVENFKGYAGMKQYFKQYSQCTYDAGLDKQICTAVPAIGYSFNVNSNETGCKTSAGIPVQVLDWSSLRDCTHEEITGTGLSKNTCSGPGAAGATVTCVNIGGSFFDDGSPLTGGGHPRFPEDMVSYAAEGALCSSILDTADPDKQLAKLRCYLSSYDDLRDSDGCVRDIRANWNATTVADFMKDDGPIKATSTFIFERFNYDSPNSGGFRKEEIHYEGIKVGNDWTDCEVHEVLNMSFRKIENSSDLMAEFITETRNVSAKPACIAYFAERSGVAKSIFKMVKK